MEEHYIIHRCTHAVWSVKDTKTKYYILRTVNSYTRVILHGESANNIHIHILYNNIYYVLSIYILCTYMQRVRWPESRLECLKIKISGHIFYGEWIIYFIEFKFCATNSRRSLSIMLYICTMKLNLKSIRYYTQKNV